MPKRILKKAVTKRNVAKVVQPEVLNKVSSLSDSVNFKAFSPKLVLLGLLLIILLVVGYKNKNLFIVATVNGQPLWKATVENKLMSQFGPQAVDEIIGEMLIRQAASQKKISVSKAEIDAKISEIEKSLNGQVTLKDALAQQGDTIESFRQRIELQLLLEKLTAGQVVVTDKDIADYIEKNKATLTATEEGAMVEEARKLVTAQKQNEVLRQYFADLKAKAKVTKFL
ncbi:SurA N-terminal domain-containing protein [Candidatus Microgenomates bacterium]|nr:SurA N-terminal domain-containing protein [Candidatus Microgenomates bacterium]